MSPAVALSLETLPAAVAFFVGGVAAWDCQSHFQGEEALYREKTDTHVRLDGRQVHNREQ